MMIDGKPFDGSIHTVGGGYAEYYVRGEQTSFEMYIVHRVAEIDNRLTKIESLMWQILQEVQKQK